CMGQSKERRDEEREDRSLPAEECADHRQERHVAEPHRLLAEDPAAHHADDPHDRSSDDHTLQTHHQSPPRRRRRAQRELPAQESADSRPAEGFLLLFLLGLRGLRSTGTRRLCAKDRVDEELKSPSRDSTDYCPREGLEETTPSTHSSRERRTG